MMHPNPAQHRTMRGTVDDMPRAAKADDGHPRGNCCPRARRRILDGQARRGIDAQPLRGGEIDIGVRLAAVPAVGAVDMLAEMMAEPEQPERPADIFGAARRRDRARERPKCVEEGGDAGDGIETLQLARPRPFAVRLAEIGG